MLKNRNNPKISYDQDSKLKGLSRAVSAPAATDYTDSSLDDTQDDKSPLRLAQASSLLLNYLQILQQNVMSTGQNIHKTYKKFSLTSLLSRISDIGDKFVRSYGVVGRLMTYLYSEKIVLVGAYVSLVTTSVTQSQMPQLVGNMLDVTMVEKDISGLNRQGLYFLFICTVYAVSEFFWGHLFNTLARKIKYQMKRQVYSAILKREIEFFDRQNVTDILDYNHGLISTAENICTHQFSSIGRNVIQLFYSAQMLVSISYKLLLTLVIIVPFNFAIPKIFAKIRDISNRMRPPRPHLPSSDRRLLETFQNIKIVKAFSTEDSEISMYEHMLTYNDKDDIHGSIFWASEMAFQGWYTNMTLLGIVFVGMHLVTTGEITAGVLSSFLLYSMAVTTSFKDAMNSFRNFKNSLFAAERLFRLLDESPKVAYKGGKMLPKLRGDIELRNVHFSYPVAPDVPILKDVNLTIMHGESVAFVGMSGGGKSTIVSLLLRFYDINKGNVLLDGVDIRELDLQWLHSNIGYVAQDPILFSGTIEENISYGLQNYTEQDLTDAIKMANAEFIYNTALFPSGLKNDIGEKGNRLSGGQKQRLAIARAMMRKPKILILDEATSNLDANSEYEVQNAIDNLLTSAKITVIMIAHRLSTIKKCNHIFVLKSGEIIESGSHNTLVEKGGAYKTLVEKQFNPNAHH